jgi:hypothetical protein
MVSGPADLAPPQVWRTRSEGYHWSMVLVIQKCAQAPLNMLIFSKNGWFQHVSTRDHDWVIGVIYTGLLYLFSGFNRAGIVKQFKAGPHSQLGKRDHKGLGNSKNYKNPGLSLN